MMEVYITILIIVTICILFSVCGWCCKRHKQGIVYGYTQQAVPTTNQNIVIQSSTTVPPYPTDVRHPTPHVIQPPAPGFSVPPSNMYPPNTAPGFYFPPQMGMPMGGGYPPAAGFMPTNAYPPPAMNNHSAPPPSYTEAVGSGGMPHPNPIPTNEMYAKQMPYNPNYS
ncbi:PREDICTED: extensin-like isoform X2 [Nicrophorus vespilloides]|nr:PREDICTED: extensin-like isoform X2 [Nicrophorus vespilloides]